MKAKVIGALFVISIITGFLLLGCATPAKPTAAPDQADITALKTANAKLLQDIASLRTQTAALSSNVTALKQQVAKLPTALPPITVPTEITTFQATLNNLQAQATQTKARQDQLTADVQASIKANQDYVAKYLATQYMTQKDRLVLESRLATDEARIATLEGIIKAHGW